LGAPGEPHIAAIYENDRLVGIAPLALEGATAHFLGTHEVCDYQDIVALPGKSEAVTAALIDHLQRQGITQLDLRTLRPDAGVLDALKALCPGRLETALTPDDVTFESELPDTWEGYLQQLNGKQRHEVRRKLRRLETHGPFTCRRIDTVASLDQATSAFVELFRSNRSDKADFMSGNMVDYFYDLIRALAEHGLLRLFFLDVGHAAAASVMCFDYSGVRYLYNSGYDEHYEHLSVGILSKALSIDDAITMGCRKYDFLKGPEIYKKRIGGQELQLYRCRMTL
jgi:CelD/BcsL family acetyltransferase involved in cellulose biosynthesis